MQKLQNIVLKNLRRSFRPNSIRSSVRCLSTIEYPPIESSAPQYKFPRLVNRVQMGIPEGIFGQPTCHTHPHLIPKDNLTCGITQAEYKDRRETLVNKLSSEPDCEHKNHIIVIPASTKQYMSDKIPYTFRQNSDFFYLTGCLEPSAILVMVKTPETETFKTILFVADTDNHAELWEGPRTGCANATKLFRVDEARPIDNFEMFLTQTVVAPSPAVLWHQQLEPPNAAVRDSVQDALRRHGHVTPGDPQRALHFMRVVKSPAEVQLLKDACYIGSQSVNMAMACTNPGVSEHAIGAVLEYSVKVAGAEHAAFPPVVGGGPRATHIHYVANNQLLVDGEMLLVDSGCQRAMYNSDISRVWPVSGKFSKYHRILYELVLSVQKGLLELVGQHRPPLDRLFEQMCQMLGTQLQAEGILPRNLDRERLVAEAYRLCPHHVSHYLGLDVHDSALVRRAIPLQNNMVITVEPGLYIRADDDSIPHEFRGIGIRIEDDVLITDAEPIVLTDTCLKEVDDVEAIVGKHTL